MPSKDILIVFQGNKSRIIWSLTKCMEKLDLQLHSLKVGFGKARAALSIFLPVNVRVILILRYFL